MEVFEVFLDHFLNGEPARVMFVPVPVFRMAGAALD